MVIKHSTGGKGSLERGRTLPLGPRTDYTEDEFPVYSWRDSSCHDFGERPKKPTNSPCTSGRLTRLILKHKFPPFAVPPRPKRRRSNMNGVLRRTSKLNGRRQVGEVIGPSIVVVLRLALRICLSSSCEMRSRRLPTPILALCRSSHEQITNDERQGDA